MIYPLRPPLGLQELKHLLCPEPQKAFGISARKCKNENEWGLSHFKPLRIKALRKVGKQYEKPGLLFICYSCTLDKLSHLQNKMAFVKVEQALIPHFSKFQRQPAALYAEIIRKLLAGE